MIQAPLGITAILVAHNEEHLIRQCLTSLACVADEILVAHDGPCSDRTVDIAREFTPHVWIHDVRGAPETHLVRLLRRATHDWVVRLDCDETFSPALAAALRAIKARGGDGEVTHYQAVWRAVYAPRDESQARWYERADRTTLFRRSCTRWVGIAHSPARIVGPARLLRECVYHYAPHQQYSALELFTRKLRPFSKVDAAIRIRYPIETIGFDGKTLNQILGVRERWRVNWPLFGAAPLAAAATAGGALRALRASSSAELMRNLRWPPMHGMYQLMLAWEIHRLRKQGFSPRLAPAS